MKDLESLFPPEAVAAYDQPLGKEVYPTRDAAIRAALARMIRAWPGVIIGKYFAEPSIILPLPDTDAGALADLKAELKQAIRNNARSPRQ